MGNKEKLTRNELRTIFDEFYIPTIQKAIEKEVAKERERYEANINERLQAIEEELGIEFTPESKQYSHYEHCYGQISDHPIHTGYPVYKTIPQEIERPLISITDKMKALLKHLGIMDIRKIDHPAKTEIKVIKKGLPLRSNK